MSGTADASTMTTAVPYRRLDNLLLGLALVAAILLLPLAAFVVWVIWLRPPVPEGDMGSAVLAYAVMLDLLVIVVVWLIGVVATIVGRSMETRPGRRRAFNGIAAAYLGWVALGAAYLWYCQNF